MVQSRCTFSFVYTWLIFWGNLFWMRFKNKLLPVKGDRRDHFSSHLDLYSSFCNWRVGVPKVEEKVVRGYRHYRTWNFMRLAGKKIRTCFIQACILVSDFIPGKNSDDLKLNFGCSISTFHLYQVNSKRNLKTRLEIQKSLCSILCGPYFSWGLFDIK